MTDTISGIVLAVVSEDTIRLKLISRGKANRNDYKENELIKIGRLVMPRSFEGAEKINREILENLILGMAVRCTVQFRDDDGRLVSDIMIYGYQHLKDVIN